MHFCQRLEKEYQSKLQDTKKSVEEKPIEDIKQEAMQDTVINEDKDSSEPSNCCIPNCCDKVEVMDIEDTIRTTLEDMARELENYPYVLNNETISNINSIFEEAKKNDSTTLKFILNGLPSSIKENVEEFTSARDLWLKLEKEYQNKRQDRENCRREILQ